MTADLQPIDRARTERNKLTLLFSKRNNLLRKESSLFQNLQGCCKQWWNDKEKRRFLHKLGLKSCQWIECKWRKEGVHSCGWTKAQEEAAILKFLNIPVKRTGLIPTDWKTQSLNINPLTSGAPSSTQKYNRSEIPSTVAGHLQRRNA